MSRVRVRDLGRGIEAPPNRSGAIRRWGHDAVSSHDLGHGVWATADGRPWHVTRRSPPRYPIEADLWLHADEQSDRRVAGIAVGGRARACDELDRTRRTCAGDVRLPSLVWFLLHVKGLGAEDVIERLEHLVPRRGTRGKLVYLVLRLAETIDARAVLADLPWPMPVWFR